MDAKAEAREAWATHGVDIDKVLAHALAIIDEKAAELRELERPTLAESDWIADE